MGKKKAAGQDGKVKEKSFRLNRANVGCTWSCPVEAAENPIKVCAGAGDPKQGIVDFVVSGIGPCNYVVCEEKHASGKLHYHALFKFHAKLDITNPRAFDICGVHPNIVNPGKGWITYVKKAGNFITNIETQIPLWERTKDMSVREAMQLYATEKPEYMARDYTRIQSNLRKRSMDDAFEWDKPLHTQFKIESMPTYPEGKCLHLWGLARAGKTMLAKNLFEKYVIITDIDQLDDDSIPWEEVQCIIFDEFIPKVMMKNVYQIINLVDRADEKSVGGRYRARMNRHRIPKIFTSNEKDIFFDPESVDAEVQRAILDRVVQHHVMNKLF